MYISKLTRFSLLALVVVLIAGCSGWGTRSRAPIRHNVWDTRYHGKRFAENDFMLEVIRFEDVRRPRDRSPDIQDNLIYEYQPDELLSGVKYRIPVLLEKHFDQNYVESPIYRVEVELLKLRTVMRTGGWMDGSFGKYDVELHATVIVRKPDSSLLFKDTFEIEVDRPRTGGQGRGPSSRQDKARLYDLTEAAIRQIAQKVAWRTRRAHAQWVEDLRDYEREQEEELRQREY